MKPWERYQDGPWAKYAPRPEPEPEGPGALQQIGRQLGLTARAPVNAALSIPAMIGDVLTGGRSTPAVKRVLDAVFPAPANATERIAQDVAGGMAAGGGIAKATKTLPTILQQVLASGGGAAGSSGAREGGFGPVGQIVGGIAGGVVAPSVATTAVEGGKAAMRGVRALADPFTEAGRRNIVARTMQSQAKDPRAAAEAINSAQTYVPGSIPNTAEASGDAGLAALQKAARNQRPAAFAEHAAGQDAARQEYLRQVFGTNVDIDAAKAAREAATRPLREEALREANIGGVVAPRLQRQIQGKTQSRISALQDAGQMQTAAAQQQVLADRFTPIPGMPRAPGALSNNAERVPEFTAGADDALRIAAQRRVERAILEGSLQKLKAHGYMPLESSELQAQIGKLKNAPGKRASDVVQKTLGAVEEKIAAFSDENGVIDARDLYTIRKEIGNTVQQFSKETANWDKRLTASLETSIKGYIDNAIIKAGGRGWKEYLTKYADATKGIEAREIGQEIATKALNPTTERLSPAMFARQMANRAEDVAGMGAQGSNALTRVNQDLRRSVAPDAVMRVPGSDTLQNLVGANVLQRMTGAGTGAGPVSKLAGGLLGKVYGPLETQTQDLLTRAMLDKDLGSSLLSLQMAQNPKLRDELLRRMMMIPSAGLLGTAIGQ